MDKALVFWSKDYRFEPCQGHFCSFRSYSLKDKTYNPSKLLRFSRALHKLWTFIQPSECVYIKEFRSPVAKWIRHWPPEPKIAGSSCQCASVISHTLSIICICLIHMINSVWCLKKWWFLWCHGEQRLHARVKSWSCSFFAYVFWINSCDDQREREKSKKCKKLTAPWRLPRRSPTLVLTGPCAA